MGMAGRKKIYDILSEAGVPGIVRERTPVFADR
jgi:tRNA(Ile)-lysidine synthetase-like protein